MKSNVGWGCEFCTRNSPVKFSVHLLFAHFGEFFLFGLHVWCNLPYFWTFFGHFLRQYEWFFIIMFILSLMWHYLLIVVKFSKPNVGWGCEFCTRNSPVKCSVHSLFAHFGEFFLFGLHVWCILPYFWAFFGIFLRQYECFFTIMFILSLRRSFLLSIDKLFEI